MSTLLGQSGAAALPGARHERERGQNHKEGQCLITSAKAFSNVRAGRKRLAARLSNNPMAITLPGTGSASHGAKRQLSWLSPTAAASCAPLTRTFQASAEVVGWP